MQPLPGIIKSHTLDPLAIPSLVVKLTQQLTLGAGQFMLAYHPHEMPAARTRLFPVGATSDGVIFSIISGAKAAK